jgi:hypothetical protein
MVGGRRIRGESCLKPAEIKKRIEEVLDLGENASENEGRKREKKREQDRWIS